MKSLLITLLLISTLSFSFGQKSFCMGWEDGFKSGKTAQNDQVFIVPICPIPKINSDTYEIGFELGYEKATGTKVMVIPESEKNTEDPFCDGWEKGFTLAMNEHNKSIFIVPICPISKINEDSFEAGYLRGYNKALEKLGETKSEKTIIPSNQDKNFCDGWEKGYQFGLQEWAIDNNKRKANRLTPICPIARINHDTYQDGFNRGRQRAFEDME